MEDKISQVIKAMLAVQRYPWEQGVCMQAMYEYGDVTTMIAMAHDAVLRQKEDGRLAVINENVAVTDPAANGIGVKKAYDITKDEMYGVAARKMLSYLMNDAPRTKEGILCHNEVSFHEGFSSHQVWADSIYMAPPFLAEMGEIDEAAFQILGMYSYLVDPDTGLLRHIYDAGNGRFVRDKLWATGNGWALMGIASVCSIAKNHHRDDVVSKLMPISQSIVDGMIKYQLSDGRFHDCLNEENTFMDGTSAMMMASYIYRSVGEGLLPESYIVYADKVYESMDEYIDDYGIIHEVCGCPNFDREGTSAESMAAYIMMHAWKGWKK